MHNKTSTEVHYFGRLTTSFVRAQVVTRQADLAGAPCQQAGGCSFVAAAAGASTLLLAALA